MRPRNSLPQDEHSVGRFVRLLTVLVVINVCGYAGDAVSREPVAPPENGPVVVQIRAFLDRCLERFPDFARKNRSAAQAWKKQAAKIIQHAEQDPALATAMKESRAQSAAEAARVEPAELEILCENLALQVLGATPEPGYETPLKAWTRMVDALRKSNIGAAMQSFSPGVRRSFEALFGGMSSDRLNGFIAAFARIEGFSILGDDLAFGTCLLPDHQLIEIHFMRINERWYIVDIV